MRPPPIQVQNGSKNLTELGCGRLADIRGVPAV